MDYMIEDLEKIDSSQSMIWGNKATCLADAKRNGIPVLDGFCISIQEKSVGSMHFHFKEDIEAYFESLIKRTGTRHFIARSSAQGEDGETHIFPGIYKSKRNISNATELLEAVELCCKSFRAEAAKLYMKSLNLTKTKQERFCVLIQEQMEPEYSGVLFTSIPVPDRDAQNGYYVELVKGHCYDMLQGKEHANAYMLERTAGGFQERLMSGSTEIDGEIRGMLAQLGEIVDHAVTRYGQALDIEWGYSQKKFAIFQIRSVPLQGEVFPKEKNRPMEIGLKADAMEKFHTLGLFPKKLLILEPGKELQEVERCIREADGLNGSITVRYSYNRELGLPRYFAADKEAAFHFIQMTYDPKWAIILHENISITDSYELCLDAEKSVLEHVPGIWESDSKIATDLWVYEGKRVTAFAANNVRSAKYEEVSETKYFEVEPYSEAEVKRIATTIFPYIRILRQNWPIKCGTNFHFVSDCDGRFYFLNHRELSKSLKWMGTQEKLTVIESIDDLLTWKGGDILLKIDLKRGEEMLLTKYVPFFKAAKVKVYVQFGILSHPAILLREMGVQIYPEYTLHKKYSFEIPV